MAANANYNPVKTAKSSARTPVYRYNTQTCRYERVGVTTGSVLSYIASLAVMASLMLAGLLLLHDYLIDSEKEIAFKKENRAIIASNAVLTKQLGEIETSLASLSDHDAQLHKKFFSSELVIESALRNDRQNILLAEPAQLHLEIDKTNIRSKDLFQRSAETNRLFSDIALDDIKSITSLPLQLPVNGISQENLISGFGLRINPFHKGLYHHDGVDIAVPRGTNVMATASGKVLVAKISSLNAGYGSHVEIDHGNGLITRYAHLDDVLVKQGEQIEAGTVIGLSGNSGGSVAPHLHYEVLRADKHVDPVMFFVAGVKPGLHETLVSAAKKQNQSLD